MVHWERRHGELERDERDERDERYEQLVELAPDGIIIHDGERILAANASALRLAGASARDELVGKPVSILLDPPYLRAAAQVLGDGPEPAGYTAPVRDTFRRLDGTTIAVEVRAVVFLDQGQPAAHLVIRDITERLALEESARQLELKMQQAQRAEAVGALAGGVAHELNNMIAIILGHASFVLDDPLSPAGTIADVREIAKAAERAATVTRQLLAFSRLAVNRPEMAELGSALAETEMAVRRMLASTRRVTIRPERAPFVCVDASQLMQVILILVTNARDATPIGGRITLESGTMVLSESLAAAGDRVIPPGRYGLLSVSDDGVGIDPAILPQIFAPFFTTKPLGEGAGLGLAAAQGILAQNNGFITVESEPGNGTTFRIYLPEVDQVAASSTGGQARQPARSAGNGRSGRSVLVIDDEPAIRALASRVLRQAGLEVALASDGVDALEQIGRRGPPDLVITDLRMPRMGGIDLMRQLRSRWPDLPVLLMSGYSAEYLKFEGTIGQLDELIQKPFTPEYLRSRVDATLALSEAAGTTPIA